MNRRLAAAAAAVGALLLAVRLSGPRSERPAPAPAPAPVPIVEGEGSRAETPREPERRPEPAPLPQPAPSGPTDAPALEVGDLSFPSSDERTPEGQVIYQHHFYFPLTGRGSLVRNAVRVTVDGKYLGAQVLPAPEPDPLGGRLDRRHPARVLRIPVGSPDRPHTVVIEHQQDQGRPKPVLNRNTFRREAGPRNDWRMIRSQWAPDGVTLQDLELPRRMGSMGQ